MEKRYEQAYIELGEIDHLNQIGLPEFMNEILKTFQEKKIFYRFLREDIQKIIKEFSTFKDPNDLSEWNNKIEENFYERLDEYVEMAIICAFIYIIFRSETLVFLDKSSWLYCISKLILLVYPISRLDLITLMTFYYRTAKLLLAGAEKYLELKTVEINLSDSHGDNSN
jgi:hypothetical protein